MHGCITYLRSFAHLANDRKKQIVDLSLVPAKLSFEVARSMLAQ